MKINTWGVASLIGLVAALLVCPITEKLVHNAHACLIPIIVLYICALAFGVVAAVRGNKWWLLIPLCSALLAVQALMALLVE